MKSMYARPPANQTNKNSVYVYIARQRGGYPKGGFFQKEFKSQVPLTPELLYDDGAQDDGRYVCREEDEIQGECDEFVPRVEGYDA